MKNTDMKSPDDFVVIDNGNENYQLIVNKEYSEEDAAFVVDGDQIAFLDADISVNKKDCYRYKDIDLIEFWEFYITMNELDLNDNDLLLVGFQYHTYTEDASIPGADLIYVLDNGDSSWLVYSFRGVLKNNDKYYCFELLDTVYPDGVYDYVINQEFDQFHPAFASRTGYEYPQWYYDKFIEWFELNNFEYQKIQ